MDQFKYKIVNKCVFLQKCYQNGVKTSQAFNQLVDLSQKLFFSKILTFLHKINRSFCNLLKESFCPDIAH